MQNTFYTCGMCGRVLPGRSSSCPFCGACFSGVHCRNCGYTGAGSDSPATSALMRRIPSGARPGNPNRAGGRAPWLRGMRVPACIGLWPSEFWLAQSAAPVSIWQGDTDLVPWDQFLGVSSEKDAPRMTSENGERAFRFSGRRLPRVPAPFRHTRGTGGRIRSPGDSSSPTAGAGTRESGAPARA